jgi:Flp pilus assembly pilin Flp
MKRKLQKLPKKQGGASAIEYALIAGLLAAILVAAIGVVGGGFGTTFDNIVACMTGDSANCS